jgi:hypothetical protein
MPHVFRGLFLDARIGFVLGCFAIAAVRPILPHALPRLVLHGALIGVIIVKAATLIPIWDARQREYAEFRAALPAIERGSRILTVHDSGDPATVPTYSTRWYMAAHVLMPDLAQSLAWRNLDTLAVVDRQVFTPGLFTNPSAQPMRAATRHRDIDPVNPARRLSVPMFVAGADPEAAADQRARAAAHGEIAFWAGWPQHFDYVLVVRYPGVGRARLEDLPLIVVASGTYFDIYAVAKPAAIMARP